jgi:hypothetical protein
MTTFSKLELSGSTDGRGIKVAATSSPGTAIHTATSSTTTGYDEEWLYAVNRLLTVQWGGTTSPDDDCKLTLLPKAGRILVVPGEILQNSLLVKAYADATNVVIISGFVNRIG